MGAKLHLKLTVGILVVFGLLILGYVLYEPAWWMWQEHMLCSEDPRTRDTAAISVAKKGKDADSHLAKWLDSKDKRLYFGACRVLEIMAEN